MYMIQTARFASILAPISVGGGATATTAELDTAPNGVPYNYVFILVHSGLIPSTGFATIKLQETDTSGSGQVDVTGGAFTALVDADDNKLFGLFIDMNKRKRFLSLVMTNGATNASLISASAIMFRSDEIPDTAALRNLAQQLLI